MSSVLKVKYGDIKLIDFLVHSERDMVEKEYREDLRSYMLSIKLELESLKDSDMNNDIAFEDEYDDILDLVDKLINNDKRCLRNIARTFDHLQSELNEYMEYYLEACGYDEVFNKVYEYLNELQFTIIEDIKNFVTC